MYVLGSLVEVVNVAIFIIYYRFLFCILYLFYVLIYHINQEI